MYLNITEFNKILVQMENMFTLHFIVYIFADSKEVSAKNYTCHI